MAKVKLNITLSLSFLQLEWLIKNTDQVQNKGHRYRNQYQNQAGNHYPKKSVQQFYTGCEFLFHYL